MLGLPIAARPCGDGGQRSRRYRTALERKRLFEPKSSAADRFLALGC